MTDLSQIFIFILAFFGLFFGLSIVLILVVNRTNKESKLQEKEVGVKEKEVIIKEVVMIPCEYCGSLTPQSSQFCSNCGAPKKGK